MNPRQAAIAAIEKIGGPAATQRALQPTTNRDDAIRFQWRVASWKRSQIPAEWVNEVSRLSGISKHLLAPRIFPNEAA